MDTITAILPLARFTRSSPAWRQAPAPTFTATATAPLPRHLSRSCRPPVGEALFRVTAPVVTAATPTAPASGLCRPAVTRNISGPIPIVTVAPTATTPQQPATPASV